VAAVVAVALLLWSRLVPALQKPTAFATAGALFAAPALWASSVLFQGTTSGMGSVAAAAGPPQTMAGHGHRHGASGMLADLTPAEIDKGLKDFERGPDPAITRFITARRGSRRYAAVVDGSMAAASYLARDIPVLPMGGFTGDAPAPSLSGLAALVARGEVRYAVLGGIRLGDSKTPDPRTQWIRRTCATVPHLADVYDCAGGLSVPRHGM
jgi:hypothetical protein